jgi:hypothetical protein
MMRMVSVETASLSDKSPKQPHCQIKVQDSLQSSISAISWCGYQVDVILIIITGMSSER